MCMSVDTIKSSPFIFVALVTVGSEAAFILTTAKPPNVELVVVYDVPEFADDIL